MSELEELKERAKKGDAEAQYLIGSMYRWGDDGVPEDPIEAMGWYGLAAKQGHAKAQYSLGVIYEEGEIVLFQSEEAIRWYKLAAEQGHADAQYNLGVIYDEGELVPQDCEEAIRWYKLAADQGYADAQYNLGVLYDNGYGTHQDYEEAAKWYKLAAEQGCSDAQYNLGVLYEDGNGVPQSDKEAMRWYIRAAGQGDVDAEDNYDELRKKVPANRDVPVRPVDETRSKYLEEHIEEFERMELLYDVMSAIMRVRFYLWMEPPVLDTYITREGERYIRSICSETPDESESENVLSGFNEGDIVWWEVEQFSAAHAGEQWIFEAADKVLRGESPYDLEEMKEARSMFDSFSESIEKIATEVAPHIIGEYADIIKDMLEGDDEEDENDNDDRSE
jgi:hypothetical protein